MTETIMQRVARASANVPKISQEELAGIMDRDDVLIVDVRDHPELANGKVRGAYFVTVKYTGP